jgi:aminopeptidase N
MTKIFRILLCAGTLFPLSTLAQVVRYQAAIEPDLQNKTVSGSVIVDFKPLPDSPQALLLDAGALTITSATENGRPLEVEKNGSKLRIKIAAAAPATLRTVTIHYHGKPAYGISFYADVAQVFTAFSTSQWMPCVDAPDQRAAFDLTLTLPQDLPAVANGVLRRRELLADGRLRMSWSQQTPMPTYLFGFAAGALRDVTVPGSITLRYLAPVDLSEAQIRQVFAATPDMLAFYADKAGMPYPGASYTQVLAKGGVAQEMDGFAAMGDKYAARVLEDEKKIWLGAHELAHQWWGNGLTNRDWTHFWLNEGIATFMTAAYLEHRFGRAEYMQNIDNAQRKYEAIRAAGHDKSLVFPNWDKPTADDRSLVYDKGTYVMHLLREQMGETAFWAGLRSYTRQYWGQSVTTAQFQAAMEQAGGQDLSAFFAKWVTLTSH